MRDKLVSKLDQDRIKMIIKTIKEFQTSEQKSWMVTIVLQQIEEYSI